MLFAEVILKNLLRRKTRTALTIVGLSASAAAMTALLSVAHSYAGSAVDYYSSRGVDIVVVRAGVAERLTSSLRASQGNALSAFSEVAAVDGSLTEMVTLGERTLVGIPLHGLDPAGTSIGNLCVAEGRSLTASDRQVVLLGEALARAVGKKVGDSVEIEKTPCRVVGLFRTDNALEANTAVAPLADVQTLMGREGQVSEFQVRVVPGLGEPALRDLCRRIESLRDGSGRKLGFKALPTRQFVASDMETRLTSGMAWGTSVLAAFLSIVGTLNAMLMSVLERTREFGLLRAIGWKRRRVVRLVLGESLVLCAAGAAGGVVMAGVLVRFAAAWSFTRNFVQPDLFPGAVFLGIACTVAAGLAGAAYPAYRGATISPTEALRFE